MYKRQDYDTVMELTNRVTEMLTQASTARIEKDGHVLTLDLAGRPGIPSPGVYREKGPVSYTHLDVDKRQPAGRSRPA